MNLEIPMEWVVLPLGLLVGSFLNVCIHRIPRCISVIAPPSMCPACGSRIRAYDNTPILSFALLRGRCRSCSSRISWQYPGVEIVTALLFWIAARQDVGSVFLVFELAWISILIVITVVDLRHQIIPNALTLPGVVLSLLARVVTGGSLFDGIAGVVVGAGSLLFIAWVYRRLTGVDGMGGGDIKLMGMVGAFLGWQGALFVIFAASVAGSAVGILLAWRRRTGRLTPLPFGSFLSPTAVMVLFLGPDFQLALAPWIS